MQVDFLTLSISLLGLFENDGLIPGILLCSGAFTSSLDHGQLGDITLCDFVDMLFEGVL